jgi:hypothetical protein
MLMGITEYARHRGVSLPAVQHAVKAGRITRNPDGLIDSDRADREWEQNTDHSKVPLDQRKGIPKKRAGQGPTPPAATGHVQAGRHRAATHAVRHAEQDAAELGSTERLATGPDFSKARAAKEIYEARIKKLDYEERLGNLVSRKSVEVEAFTNFRILRDACFNIPDRVSAQIAAETDGSTVYEILMVELRRAFEEFANRESSPREGAAA